jgi:DnaJ family protein C protein 9
MSAKIVKEAFGSTSLYSILQVEKTATSEQLKRAYYKAALRYHPDKQAGASAEAALEATKKFQALGFIHSLLSDSSRRAQYDRSGRLDDVDDETTDDVAAGAWYDYWRDFFAPVTEEAVLAFEKSYRGSEEEKGDILRSYDVNKGNLDGVLSDIMCSTEEDAPRFVKIIQKAIRAEEVKAHKKFVNEYGTGEDVDEDDNDNDVNDIEEGEGGPSSSSAAGGRMKKTSSASTKKPTAKGIVAAKRAAQARATAASREAKEAEELLSDLKAKFLAKKGGGGGGGGEPSLTDLLMANRESRQNKFADILSKYDSSEGRGGGGGKGGKSRGREMMIEDGSRMEEESGESPKRRARK